MVYDLNQTKPIFYTTFHILIACNCDVDGSIDSSCNASTGACTCKVGFVGSKCNRYTVDIIYATYIIFIYYLK